MRLTHLSLTNFRNYGRLELPIADGTTIIHGANAQGKTNLLEAIYYLATTRSPHTNQDSQIMNWLLEERGDPIAVTRLVGNVETDDRLRQIELRLIRELKRDGFGFRREALVDRRKVRLMDVLGNLRVVIFLPQDMALITGAPAARRRYLDITLCQTDRHYCATLSQYNKILDQRNAYLRSLQERGVMQDLDGVLAIFSDQLAELGGKIIHRRARFLSELSRHIQRVHYEHLTAGDETINLIYRPNLSEDPQAIGLEKPLAERDTASIQRDMRDALEARTSKDIMRGATSIGPHRDDWSLHLNQRDLRLYGSRGQVRSALMALKIGEVAWIEDEAGEPPLLLLDDILAELDPNRRDLLLSAIISIPQVLITTADIDVIPPSFQEKATTLVVKEGQIR